mmetsp:Transcript_20575/g.48822  ORF Transcript_20575/g.48822 Transcript_20575/m.48822 type:complete len:82 (-) Transcript_20575:289-534(-)
MLSTTVADMLLVSFIRSFVQGFARNISSQVYSSSSSSSRGVQFETSLRIANLPSWGCYHRIQPEIHHVRQILVSCVGLMLD